MSQSIPTQGIPYYSLRCKLEGVDFKFEFTYSSRASRFYLNLYSAEDVLLVAGLKMVTGIPLLHFYKYKGGFPAGDLMVIATGADDSSPSLLELQPGARCELIYFSATEVVELTGG